MKFTLKRQPGVVVEGPPGEFADVLAKARLGAGRGALMGVIDRAWDGLAKADVRDAADVFDLGDQSPPVGGNPHMEPDTDDLGGDDDDHDGCAGERRRKRRFEKAWGVCSRCAKPMAALPPDFETLKCTGCGHNAPLRHGALTFTKAPMPGAATAGGAGAGSRGGKFYVNDQGRVVYGERSAPRAPAAPAATPLGRPLQFRAPGPPVRGGARAQARRFATQATAARSAPAVALKQSGPRNPKVQTFAKVYEQVREAIMAMVEKAKGFATDAKLKLFHSTLKSQHTWHGFEHKVRKVGGDAEELVTHAFIEMPEIFEHIAHLAHSLGHSVLHAAMEHGPTVAAHAGQVVHHLVKAEAECLKAVQLGFIGGGFAGKRGAPVSDGSDHAPGSRDNCPGCKEFRARQGSLPLSGSAAGASAAREQPARPVAGVRLRTAGDKPKAPKRSGEGSRGGKIVGHTRTGKPIYDQYNHPAHKGFTDRDHLDAMRVHNEHKDRLLGEGKREQAFKHAAQAINHMGAPEEDGTPSQASVDRKRDASIMGQTRSGRMVRGHFAHHDHDGYDADDHRDAAGVHRRHAEAAGAAKDVHNQEHHLRQAQQHEAAASSTPEGSIGKTSSGKHIVMGREPAEDYRAGHYKGWTSKDHADAATAHARLSTGANDTHDTRAKYHSGHAQRLEQEEAGPQPDADPLAAASSHLARIKQASRDKDPGAGHRGLEEMGAHLKEHAGRMGTTRSGKPIHAHIEHAAHAGYTPNDHLDAAKAHREARDKVALDEDPGRKLYHSAMALNHFDAAER